MSGGLFRAAALCALVAAGCIAPRTPAPFDPFQRYAQPPYGVAPPPPAMAAPGPGGQFASPPVIVQPGITQPGVIQPGTTQPGAPTPAPQESPARAALQLRANSPAQAKRGATFTVDLEVTNAGTSAARSVTVQFQPPPGSSLVGSVPPAQAVGGLPTWRLGDLAAGQTRAIEVDVRADQAGAFNLCATARTIDGISARDCARTTVPTPAAPLEEEEPAAQADNAAVDLTVTGPQRATIGDDVTFAIVVANNGQAAATGLLLRADFPPGLQHEMDPSRIERDLEDLAPGDSIEVAVTFRVAEAGRLCADFAITGDVGLSDSVQRCVNASEAAAAQPPAAGNPRLEVTHTAPTEAAVGGQAEFVIEVKNTGDAPLTRLNIAAQYDAALAPSADGQPGDERGRLAWRYSSLAPGKSLRLPVECDCLRAAEQACGRVTVTSQEGARDEAEACLAILSPETELTVTIVELTDPVAVGKEFTFNVRVTNASAAADRNVVLTVKLPPELSMVPLGTSGPNSSRPSTPENDPRTITFDPLPALAANTTVTYRVHVRAERAGTVTSTVTVDSAGLEQPVTEQETTEIVEQ